MLKFLGSKIHEAALLGCWPVEFKIQDTKYFEIMKCKNAKFFMSMFSYIQNSKTFRV